MAKKKHGDVLYLSLKKPWFDMIKAGIKLEEYREMNDYWGKRLPCHQVLTCSRRFECDNSCMQYRYVEFTLAYPPKNDAERRIRFEYPRLHVREGKPEWGAELGKKYYAITWGKQVPIGDSDEN